MGLRQQLKEFANAWQQGQAMSVESATEYALRLEVSDTR